MERGVEDRELLVHGVDAEREEGRSASARNSAIVCEPKAGSVGAVGDEEGSVAETVDSLSLQLAKIVVPELADAEHVVVVDAVADLHEERCQPRFERIRQQLVYNSNSPP